MPHDDRAFGDAFAHLGHDDLYATFAHGLSLGLRHLFLYWRFIRGFLCFIGGFRSLVGCSVLGCSIRCGVCLCGGVRSLGVFCGWRVGRRLAYGFRIGFQHGNDGAYFNRIAFFHHDLGERSFCRGRHLGVHLVGPNLQQRLVQFNLVTDFLVPHDDRAFGDAFAHLGHGDFNLRHGNGRVAWG